MIAETVSRSACVLPKDFGPHRLGGYIRSVPRVGRLVRDSQAVLSRCFAENNLREPPRAAASMLTLGRNRNGWFGVSNANKQTFVHGDCQRQPSAPSGGSATAAATAGIDPTWS